MFEETGPAAAAAARRPQADEADPSLDALRAALASRPGPELALAALAASDPTTLLRLGESGALDLARAGQWIESWGAWLRLQGLQAMFRSRRRLDPREVDSLNSIEDVQELLAAARRLQADNDDLAARSVVAEAAAYGGVSEYSQNRCLATAQELTRLPGTAEALRTGAVDYAKARTIADAVRGLTDPEAAEVESRCLPAASRQTTRGLEASLAAAILEVAPDEAERRHQLAKADHGVRFRLGQDLAGANADGLPDGTGEMTARMGAEDLLNLQANLDLLAEAAKFPGDTRTKRQRRLHVLVDLLANSATRGAPAGGPDSEPGPESGDEPELEPERQAAHERRAGARPGPEGDLGTMPDAERGTDAHLAAEPGAKAGSGSEDGPGSEDAWARISDSVLPDPDRPSMPGRSGSGAAAAQPRIIVTVGLDTLLGRDHAPGHLDGYGPIPASMARDLATRGVWRCAATDGHGTILGLGRSTFTPHYRPPGATARFVKLRDRTCVFPGCRRQSRGCDVDHQEPYRLGGATCDCNLRSLCRHHHRLKHQAGFRVRVSGDPDDPPDTLVWTTPTKRQVPRYPMPATRPRPPGEPRPPEEPLPPAEPPF